MSDIKKVIEGLELIETVIPSYKHARRKGITDDEAETVVNWAVEQAIILLERVIPYGNCDNFDYQTGCKWHPAAEKEE